MTGSELHGALEETLKERLEADIVIGLAQRLSLDEHEALKRYYKSRLATQIADGTLGLQYLDASYLIDDLLENESDVVG